MRIRTVKPEFWDDETICGLSRDARLLFIATFNLADDEGILRWTAEKLKALAFMYDDDVSVTRVAELMHELVAARLVAPYSHHSSLLAWVVNFHRHQRVNRPQPSKFPPPSLQNPAVAVTYAERDHWTCHLCGGPVNRKPHRVIDPYSMTEPEDISSLNASLDHLVPKSKGGSDYPSNIRLAHIGCNKSRRDKAIGDFVRPTSVARALEALTSGDAPAVTVPDFFTADSVNDPATRTDHSPPEVEVEVEVEVEQRKGKKTPSSADADAAFDEFWSLYPRKVGKQDARKVWDRKLKTTPAGEIVAGLRRYVPVYEKTERDFIPHPSTWLQQGRWEDDVPAPQVQDEIDVNPWITR